MGQTLAASNIFFADADGLSSSTFAYQWLADDTEISGATSATYTIVDSDEGKTIKVRVTFTDDSGSVESLTSEATGTVSAFYLSGITSADYAENGTTTVATYAVTGAADGATITWSITGDDSDDFSMSSTRER